MALYKESSAMKNKMCSIMLLLLLLLLLPQSIKSICEWRPVRHFGLCVCKEGT